MGKLVKIFILIIVSLLFVRPQSVFAANIAVGGTCTLIDAITAANTDTATGGCSAGSGADTIILTADVSLTNVNNATDGDNGLPSITSNITIEGNGFTINRPLSSPDFRIFHVAGAGTLTLVNVTVSGGELASDLGGGIYNRGTVTLANSILSGNSATNGGGIYNQSSGTVTLTNSTISGNSATNGGGINNGGNTVALTNSTISGNSATNNGGGIHVSSGTVTLTNSTISNNSATNNGGGINNGSGTAILTNSLIANSTGDNCSGTISSGGNNLSSDATCSVPQSGSINLGALANNGGPTQTHALLVGSSAIDAANNASCPADDQRGAARGVDGDGTPDSPQTGDCDIGAYEYLGVVPTVAFTVDVTSVNEGDIATVTVTPVNHTVGGDITVQFTIGGTATLTTDYTLAGLGANNTLTFAPNGGAQNFTISTLVDALIEGNETVILDMSLVSGAADIAGTTPQTVTIVGSQNNTATPVPTATPGNGAPQIDILDPALSKVGALSSGQVGFVGEEIEWTITVTNNGNSVSNNIVLVDNIVPTLQIDGVSGNVNSTINGQTVTVTIPTLNPGQSVSYSIFTTVLESSITVNNTVCLSTDNTEREVCTQAQVNTGLAVVTQLPATGETPYWRNPLMFGLVLGGLLALIGLGAVIWRQVR